MIIISINGENTDNITFTHRLHSAHIYILEKKNPFTRSWQLIQLANHNSLAWLDWFGVHSVVLLPWQ